MNTKSFIATLLNGPGTIALTFEAATPSAVIEQIWATHGMSAHIVNIEELIADAN